jgi:hypothetical protein
MTQTPYKSQCKGCRAARKRLGEIRLATRMFKPRRTCRHTGLKPYPPVGRHTVCQAGEMRLATREIFFVVNIEMGPRPAIHAESKRLCMTTPGRWCPSIASTLNIETTGSDWHLVEFNTLLIPCRQPVAVHLGVWTDTTTTEILLGKRLRLRKRSKRHNKQGCVSSKWMPEWGFPGGHEIHRRPDWHDPMNSPQCLALAGRIDGIRPMRSSPLAARSKRSSSWARSMQLHHRMIHMQPCHITHHMSRDLTVRRRLVTRPLPHLTNRVQTLCAKRHKILAQQQWWRRRSRTHQWYQH